MTHTKTKYLCDFCNREYVEERLANRHEGQCYHDPDNAACATCKHFLQYDSDEDGAYRFGCAVNAMPRDGNQQHLTHDCVMHERKETKINRSITQSEKPCELFYTETIASLERERVALREALNSLLDACYGADCHEELVNEISGKLVEAEEALK